MVSKLIITSVESLQKEIINALINKKDKIGIYVSLNKPQKSIEEILIKNNIQTDKLFFIDCVTSVKSRDDVLHISPSNLEKLSYAINTFIKDIKGEKFLIIDALSTLLIYNNENNVASFVKKITESATEKDVEIISFSPETKGEELLNKIFNFYDEVQRK